jgi:hypothetical protein
MLSRFTAVAIVLLAAPAFSMFLFAQTDRVQPTAPAKNEKAEPAPPRSLAGIWDSGRKGVLPTTGVIRPPMTAWGQEKANSYKPGWGPREVPVALTNDPLDSCDPAGFPRQNLFELRTIQIVQNPEQVLILYQYQRVWRVIWTDGRELPKDAEPRWYGYSIGKWESDDTFVVQTSGMNENTWLDDEGDPHSSELRVEERYHRVDRNTLELTVTIDDPKTYTKPWVPINKLVLKLQPAKTDIMEMICVPTEAQEYKKIMAEPAAAPAK